MYVPIFKSRSQEHKLFREHSDLFSGNITPLIEVIQLKVKTKEVSISELIEHYDTILDEYYIDFFTFNKADYKSFDIYKLQFSWSLQDEKVYDYDKDLLRHASESDCAIPVISIKKARSFLLDPKKVEYLIHSLQSTSRKIAIRIEAALFDDYMPLINKNLRPEDTLFFDINESTIEPFFMQVDTLKSLKGKYTKIVIHSPRPRAVNNGQYEDGDFTDLIDNSLMQHHKNEGFDGYSDYAGLKDGLPTQGGNGKGAAHVLLFDIRNFKYFSIVNDNTALGVKGYRYVVDKIFDKYLDILDPYDDCRAIAHIENQWKYNDTKGNFATWKYVTMLRTLSRIKKVYRRSSVDFFCRKRIFKKPLVI